jgi:predicted aspartyl protease
VIKGVVNSAFDAVVNLVLRGPSGRAREIEAIIDTGYNGFLTLPPALVSEIGLGFWGRGRAFGPMVKRCGLIGKGND